MTRSRHLPTAALVLFTLATGGGAAQPSTGRVRTAENALSTVLERERIFRTDAQSPRMSWNESINTFCVQFTKANPYSGRPESRVYAVTPNGDVGPGDRACAPPRPPRPPRPTAVSFEEVIRLIREDLRTRFRYPDASREADEQGLVLVALTAHRDGRVTDVVLRQSSGHSNLDIAAMDMARDLVVPVFPPSDPRDEQQLTVPIQFRLSSEPPPPPPATASRGRPAAQPRRGATPP